MKIKTLHLQDQSISVGDTHRITHRKYGRGYVEDVQVTRIVNVARTTSYGHINSDTYSQFFCVYIGVDLWQEIVTDSWRVEFYLDEEVRDD